MVTFFNIASHRRIQYEKALDAHMLNRQFGYFLDHLVTMDDMYVDSFF